MIGAAAKPFEPRQTHKLICVFDTETDPFKEGRPVYPFAAGFYDGTHYEEFWDNDWQALIARFVAWLRKESAPGGRYHGHQLLIYAHNGGKFDFNFLSDYLDAGWHANIINGRIVAARYAGHEFRDSYAILPIPLSAYAKDEIDYDKFERDVRDDHRAEILHYQRKDCEYLYQLVSAFHQRFGDRLTIGGTAFRVLNSYHGIERLSERFDAMFRDYYYGGRVQCFEAGDLTGNFKVYDVNSMYPKCMRDYLHPVSSTFMIRREITETTDFAKIEADNWGALPSRADDGSLTFDKRRGEFFATGHEIRAGIETGTLKVRRVIQAVQFFKRESFAQFIDERYSARQAAQAQGDIVNDIFEKLLMNSSYGRTAINPRKFKEYEITDGTPPDDKFGMHSETNPLGWKLDTRQRNTVIYARQLEPKAYQFCNVATAASITGAARATLLRGLSNATRPVYCDTDSIICEALNADLDNKRLGAWKLEAEGGRVAIAGKKLYCFFREGTNPKTGKPYKPKIASKGGIVSPAEMVRIASGEKVELTNPVPTFKRDGSQKKNTRKFARTGKASPFIKARARK